jgi:hypothetical protein
MRHLFHDVTDDRVHKLDDFATEMAVLLMDNFSSNMASHVIGPLTEARVYIANFRSQIRRIFHVFDVTLFHVLKRQARCELRSANEKAAVQFNRKINHDFNQIMAEFNIWEAVKTLRFEFHIRAESYRLWYNEKELRKSSGFRAIWPIAFSPDQLSTPWGDAKFGCGPPRSSGRRDSGSHAQRRDDPEYSGGRYGFLWCFWSQSSRNRIKQKWRGFMPLCSEMRVCHLNVRFGEFHDRTSNWIVNINILDINPTFCNRMKSRIL